MADNNLINEFFTLTYQNIEVSQFELVELNELKIENKFNDHARLFFTGVISEEMKDKYVETTTCKTPIEVNSTVDVNGISIPKNIFKGIITRIKVKSVRDIYYLEVEGISNTYELDIKKKNRSFQKNDMKYTEMIKKIIGKYQGSDFIDMACKEERLKRFILQYNETDWEFLKRMASHFNTGLIADMNSDKPKFWFGLRNGEEKGSLEDFHYEKRKKLSSYREASENYAKDDEENFIYYYVESTKVCNVGDKVLFKGMSMVIMEAAISMEKGKVKCEYILTNKDGIKNNLILNKEIKGLSLEGKVIDVKSDMVKIHLKIDSEQKKEEASWIQCLTSYTSEGQTGWYCMPEINDMIKLYFPHNDEKHGIVMNSIRRRTVGGDKILKPEVKYFRTKNGKELMFSKDMIQITAKDGDELIRLSEKDGILIQSKKDINVISKDNLAVNARNIGFYAKDEIKFASNESSLKLDGDTTLKGTAVKTN